LWLTIARAICSQALPSIRASGTSAFIAAWAGIWPWRIDFWIDRGSSRTSPRRREIQLALRWKRRANSS